MDDLLGDLVPAEVLKASLGGVPLQIDRGSAIRWKLSYGTKAYSLTLDITRERAWRIWDAGQTQFPEGRTVERGDPVGPLVLEVTMPGFPDLRVEGLYVTQTAPSSDNVNREAIVISDRRVWLTRTIIERAYNTTRGSGQRRPLSPVGTPDQIAQFSEDLIHRAPTLKPNGERWTALEILKDVLREAVGEDGYTFDKNPVFVDDPGELILTRMNAAQAIDVVLGFLPGTQVYAGIDGKLHVTNSYGGAGESMAIKAGTPRFGGWNVVDRSMLRPKNVRVYSEREVELRFDATSPSSNTQRVRGEEPAILENVLPSPDPSLTLTDGTVIAQGTWITFDQALAAWQADSANATVIGQPLTDALIRRLYMVGLGTMHNLFSLTPQGGVNAIWTARIQAVEQHWRRTFRILPAWVDKIRNLKAERVALVDPENGTRGAAQCWFNYSVRPTVSGLALGPATEKQGWHVTDCYAANLDQSSGPAPALVRILDADNGIVHLDHRKDVFGRSSLIAPGTLNGTGFPEWGPGALFVAWYDATLDESWNAAVILTAIQDSPSSEARLHVEHVTADEAKEAFDTLAIEAAEAQQGRADLGNRPTIRLGETNGPDFEVWAAAETARYAWSDTLATQIRQAFTQRGPDPDQPQPTPVEFPAELMVNPDTVRALALAQAARVYAALEDRAEGYFGARFNPEIVPDGSCSQVDHVIDLERGVRTELVLPPLLEAPSWSTLVPASVRKKLRRIVT